MHSAQKGSKRIKQLFSRHPNSCLSWTRDDPSAAPGILTFNHRRKAMGTSSLEVAHCEGSMVLRSQSPHVAKTYLTRLKIRQISTDFDRFWVTALPQECKSDGKGALCYSATLMAVLDSIGGCWRYKYCETSQLTHLSTS